MPELPGGTITFLFTDIEGSTVRWERFPEEMRLALARHDGILRDCLERHGGVVFKTVGDAFYAVFSSALSAISAAIDAQEILAQEIWDERLGQLRVRMAIHTGEAEYRDNDYFGQSLNRVARILSAGHGEQILLSSATAELIRDKLPARVLLQDLDTHRLKDLQLPEHIFQVTIPNLRATFPALKTLDLRPDNLPTQLTSFIGRARDRAAIASLLRKEEIRLVTLIGPGGVGKTRLGIQVAAEVSATFPGGVYFVDLAAIDDRQGMLNALALVIGIAQGERPALFEHIKEALRGKVLLLLDNFEQVRDAALLVHELLLDVRDMTILVTSRAALHLAGEYEYHISTLPVPDAKQCPNLDELVRYEVINLFLQRAKAVKADFRLTDANASDIVEICKQLDGLPLAIELAAARANLLPPHAMVKRLERRLQLLNGKDHYHNERHQTLRGTIMWSYNLLSSAEKELFKQLAIFRKGCTLEAAEYVCQLSSGKEHNLLDVLRSLVDRNLIRLRECEEGEPRFEMLYTMREFALEYIQAKTMTALHHRHAEYYVSFMQQFDAAPVGREQTRWLGRVETEYENVLDALRWCSERRKIEDGLRLAEALCYFWWVRGCLSEGQQWFETLFRALERESQSISPELKARTLERASVFACSLNDLENAQAWAGEALHIGLQLDEKEIMSKAYVALANVAMRQGKLSSVSTYLEESLKLRQLLGDVRGMASLLNNLGNVARQEKNFARAALLHERSLNHFRQLGDEVSIAAVLNNLAEVEWCCGHSKQALALYTESWQLSCNIHYSWGIASSLVGIGDIALASAEYEKAKNLYKESLHLFQEMGDRAGIATCVESLITVLDSQHKSKDIQKTDLQAEVVGYHIGSSLLPEQALTTIERLRAELGDQLFNTLIASGHLPSLTTSILEAFKDI